MIWQLRTFGMLLVVGLFASAASGQQWTRFHGPNGSGVVKDGTIPSAWKPSDYAWTAKLPGGGIGSPVVWGDKIFLMAGDTQSAKRHVLCLNLNTGQQNWVKSFDSAQHHLHRRNRYASSTPCCDKDFVYVAWSDPKHTNVTCFSHAGEVVWTKDLGTWQSQHGFGTSPMLYQDKLIVLNSQQADQLKRGQQPGRSRMLALDRASGEIRWETPLNTTRVCYGTPCVYAPKDKKPQLIDCNTGNGLFALDPDSGKMLWNIKVFGMRCCSSPLVAGDLVIGSSGSGGGGNHLVAVKPGSEPKEQYRLERSAPYVPTSVVVDDLIFSAGDNGVVTCLDAQSGDSHWSRRVSGGISSSPIVVGDKLLTISMDGEATILRASKDYEKLGSVDLGGPVQSTPAFSGGTLLLRVDDRLMALGRKAL